MTYAAKYRISQISVAVSVAMIVLSISRIVPAGIAGNVHEVKFWFGVLITFAIIGIGSSFAYYYYRNRRFETKDQQQIAVETLAKLAEQQRKK